METLVGQRVFGLVLGSEDLVDHDELREAPLFAALAGKLEAVREDCEPLAGKSTLSRLERRPKRHGAKYHKIDPSGHGRRPARAYVLIAALRRIALKHTTLADASARTIRLKLLKIAARVGVSVRRVHFAMASSCPSKIEFEMAHIYLERAFSSA